jgi:hypothetical protein
MLLMTQPLRELLPYFFACLERRKHAAKAARLGSNHVRRFVPPEARPDGTPP